MCVRADFSERERKPVAISLGCHLVGACRPKPDMDDVESKLYGAAKRVCRKMPRRTRKHKYGLTRFVKRWLSKNLTPLDPSVAIGFEVWLQQTNYTLSRKDELRKAYYSDLLGPFHKLVTQVKGFIKEENYGEYKAPRWIKSRSDTFKCYYGPAVRAIEHEVFKNKHFIKYVSDQDRVQYMIDNVYRPGKKYVVTDYSAFEAHFNNELMTCCEFALYDYMLSKHPAHDEFMTMCYQVVGKKNHIVSKNFQFKVQARMSGEMSTSLGNGFTNLMLMLYLCQAVGNDIEVVSGVVEGDDGLFVVDIPPSEKHFKECGLIIKLEVFHDMNHASFCGIVFDEVDMQQLADPFRHLLSFGWGRRQYLQSADKTKRALLRAKSLSFLAQFPSCPVITELAKYGERVTRDITFYKMVRTLSRSHMSLYEKDMIMSRIHKKVRCLPVGMRSRLLVADKFGFPVDLQLKVESQLRNLSVLKPLLTIVPYFCHDDCVDFYSSYVTSEFEAPRLNSLRSIQRHVGIINSRVLISD